MNWDIFTSRKTIPQYFWDGLKYDDTFSMLVETYPEINWNIFTCRTTVSQNFLHFFENKRKFIDNIFHPYQIKHRKIGNKSPSRK